MKGFDAPRPVDTVIPKITAAGYGFVMRYYSYNAAKNLSLREAQKLSAAGLCIAVVWEAQGDRPSNFTAAQGARDAAEALRLAAGIGQPKGSGIYLAIDFDASPQQIGIGIVPYFKAVKSIFGTQYRIGCYGSGLVCSSLRSAGLSELFMLACAGGWQGTKEFTGAHLRQSLPVDPAHFGFEIDPDAALVGGFGQFQVALPRGA